MSMRPRMAVLVTGAALCLAPIYGCGRSPRTEEPEKIQKFVKSEHSDPDVLNAANEDVDLPQEEPEGPGDEEGSE